MGEWTVTIVLLVFTGVLHAEGPHAESPHAEASFSASLTAESRPDPKRLAETALGELLASAGDKPPTDLPGLRRFLDQAYGSTVTNIIPFSGAPAYTDLTESRLVYMSPALDVYLGAIRQKDGSIIVEFLSRNTKTNHFDFGVIRDFGKSTMRPEFVDRSRCITCHKDGGPLYYTRNWGNTLARRALFPDKETLTSTDLQTAFLPEDSSVAHHVAFLETLVKSDKEQAKRDGRKEESEWEELAKIAREHHQAFLAPKDRPVSTRNFFHFAKGKRWQGVDLIGDPARLEPNVLAANQVTLFHKIALKLNPEDRRLFVSSLLWGGICGVEPVRVQNLMGGLSSLLSKGLLLVHENDPVFLNPLTLSHLGGRTGRSEAFLDPDEILRLDQKKRERRARNVDPNEAALHLDVYDQNSGPAGGIVSIGNVDIVTSYRLSLRLPLRSYGRFCESLQFERLADGDRLPNRKELLAAIEEWKRSPEPKKDHTASSRIKSCHECHDGGSPDAPKFHFDYGDLLEWRRWLGKPSPNDGPDEKRKRREAQRWRRGVLRHLRNETMPPDPFQSHLTDLERETLVQFLDSF